MMKMTRLTAVMLIFVLTLLSLCACTKKIGGTVTTDDPDRGTSSSTTAEPPLPYEPDLSVLLENAKKQSGTYRLTITDGSEAQETYDLRLDGMGHLTLEGQDTMLRDSGSVLYMEKGETKLSFSGEGLDEFREAVNGIMQNRYSRKLDSISATSRDGSICTSEVDGDDVHGCAVFDIKENTVTLVSAELEYGQSTLELVQYTRHTFRTDTDGYADGSEYLPYMTAMCVMLSSPFELSGNVTVTNAVGADTEIILKDGAAGYDINGELMLSFFMNIKQGTTNVSETFVSVNGDVCHIEMGDIGIDVDTGLSATDALLSRIISDIPDMPEIDQDVLTGALMDILSESVTSVTTDGGKILISLDASLLFEYGDMDSEFVLCITEKDGALQVMSEPFRYEDSTMAFCFDAVPTDSNEVVPDKKTPIYLDLRDIDTMIYGISQTVSLGTWHSSGSIGISLMGMKIPATSYEASFTFDENGRFLLWAKITSPYDPMLANDCYTEIADSYGYTVYDGSAVTELVIKDDIAYLSKTVTAKMLPGISGGLSTKTATRTYKIKCTTDHMISDFGSFMLFMLNIPASEGSEDEMDSGVFLSGPTKDAFLVLTSQGSSTKKLTVDLNLLGQWIEENTDSGNPLSSLSSVRMITLTLSCNDGYMDSVIIKLSLSGVSFTLDAKLIDAGAPFDAEKIPSGIETDDSYVDLSAEQ